MGRPIPVYPGQRFGKLTLLKELVPHTYPDGRQTRKVQVACECGGSRSVLLTELRKGRTDCGCVGRTKMGDANRKHGLSSHPAYFTYTGMMNRCYSKSNSDYARYGAMGIRVCAAWRNQKSGLQTFIHWWEAQYREEGFTLDRMKNHLGYSPSNCRLVPATIQAANRGSSVLVKGKPFLVAYREASGVKVHYVTALKRFKEGMPFAKAISK